MKIHCFAVKLEVCTSTKDRYKNESCDFRPENRDKLFNKISSISGIVMSSLIQSETEYREQSQLIRDSAKDENISMPSLYYQKQLICIKRIDDTIGINSLPGNLKTVALIRLQHPNLINKQIAGALGVSYGVVVNSFLKIRYLVD